MVTDLSDSRWLLKLFPKVVSHRGAGRPRVDAEPLTEEAKCHLSVPQPALGSSAWSQEDEPKVAVLAGATPARISGLGRAVLLGSFPLNSTNGAKLSGSPCKSLPDIASPVPTPGERSALLGAGKGVVKRASEAPQDLPHEASPISAGPAEREAGIYRHSAPEQSPTRRFSRLGQWKLTPHRPGEVTTLSTSSSCPPPPHLHLDYIPWETIQATFLLAGCWEDPQSTMATLEGPGLPASQTTDRRLGNLPSKASLDSSTLPTPASPHSSSVLLHQPSSPLPPSPAKPVHAPPPAGLDRVPSPMPSSPSLRPRRGLLYSPSHFPRHTYSGPRNRQWRVCGLVQP